MTKYHHPHHLYVDDMVYFLTAKVYGNQNYLDNDTRKQLLLEKIKDIFAQYHYKLYTWIILDNQYHIELKTRFG